MLVSIFFWVLQFFISVVITAFAIAAVYKTSFNLKKAFFVVLVEVVIIILLALAFAAVFGVVGILGLI